MSGWCWPPWTGSPTGDRQSWFGEWTAIAAGLAARGHQAAAHGHLRTARWALLAAAEYYAKALARGWNAFLFDGPGQQSMLFERGVPFQYDWEAVLTPVIDALVDRPDVDASALTGYGISQGGYWIAPAVAFERRMVAAVADPGVLDVSAGWTAHRAAPAAL